MVWKTWGIEDNPEEKEDLEWMTSENKDSKTGVAQSTEKTEMRQEDFDVAKNLILLQSQ